MSDVTEALFEQTSCDVTSNVMSQQTSHGNLRCGVTTDDA